MDDREYNFRRLSLIGAARSALLTLRDEDRVAVLRDFCDRCGASGIESVGCCAREEIEAREGEGMY